MSIEWVIELVVLVIFAIPVARTWLDVNPLVWNPLGLNPSGKRKKEDLKKTLRRER